MAVEFAMEFVNNTLVPAIETLAMQVGMAVLIITLCLACMAVYVLWWKGIPLQDVETYCSTIMDLLAENISKPLAQFKKMLTDRIMNIETKLDEQNTMVGEIRDNVILMREDINRMNNKIDILRNSVKILDDKLSAMERNQGSGLASMNYLWGFAAVNGGEKGVNKGMYGGGGLDELKKNLPEDLINKVKNVLGEDLSDEDLKYMCRVASSLENAGTASLGRTTSKQ